MALALPVFGPRETLAEPVPHNSLRRCPATCRQQRIARPRARYNGLLSFRRAPYSGRWAEKRGPFWNAAAVTELPTSLPNPLPNSLPARQERLDLLATATFGLEAVVARELAALGYATKTVQAGRIRFQGDVSAICRANLWLRTADRVLLELGRFEARDFGVLFDRTFALPWDEWLGPDACFPVSGRSIKSQLSSVPACQKIVKKAIVEKLKTVYGVEWFEEQGPKYSIEVALLEDQATLTIDTSGAGLHKRGYRALVGKAPLKETLAAALILLSFWRPERQLVDPFCGSGTIPIEAALIGRTWPRAWVALSPPRPGRACRPRCGRPPATKPAASPCPTCRCASSAPTSTKTPCAWPAIIARWPAWPGRFTSSNSTSRN